MVAVVLFVDVVFDAELDDDEVGRAVVVIIVDMVVVVFDMVLDLEDD